MIRAEYVIILNLHVCGSLCVHVCVFCVCVHVCACVRVGVCVCVCVRVFLRQNVINCKGGKPKHCNTNLNGEGEAKRPDNPKPPLNYKMPKANYPMGD